MAKSYRRPIHYGKNKEIYVMQKHGLLRGSLVILGVLLVFSVFVGCSGPDGRPVPFAPVDEPAGANETGSPEDAPSPSTETGSAIEVAVSDYPDSVLPGTPVVLYTLVNHTGRPQLSFGLEEAPPGMSIDFNEGIITWIPRKVDEGKTFEVTIRVTDGGKFGQTPFRITVVKSEPFANEIQGNVLTVTDPDTNLKGLSVTVLSEGSQPTTFPVLEKPPQESIPEIPSWITALSDIFVVADPFYNPVEFRFPVPVDQLHLDQLPEGDSLSFQLYVYVETLHGDKLWSPVSIDESFEGTREDPVYVVSLAGMYGFAFFGYHIPNPPIPFADE